MSKYYSQYAIALWEPQAKRLYKKHKEFMDSCDCIHKYTTPDETYLIYFWRNISMDEIGNQLEFFNKVTSIRHSIASILSDNDTYSPIEFDNRTWDDEGCDEEFEYMFGWNAYIHFEPRNFDFE